MVKPTVYVVQEGLEELGKNVDAISMQIINKCTNDGIKPDLISIGSSCKPGPESAVSLTAYLIDIYRMHGSLKVERTTILSAEDELFGLQLCLADINLQSTGEFDAQISDVLTARSYVAERKLEEVTENKESTTTDSLLTKEQKNVFEKYQKFLENSFYADLYDLFNHYRNRSSLLEKENEKSFIVFELPVNVVEKAMFSFLCSTRDVTSVIVKESASLSENKDVTLQFHAIDNVDDLFKPDFCVKTPSQTPRIERSKLSPTQKYIQQIFLSYIDLLVNSSSSISLARVINIPDREIDHHAFTLLKRRANKSNLSMYQLAISLVMNIRLGGKGYAPDKSDPLLMYVNGLSQFVNLLQSLHTILEDEPDFKLACHKVVRVIKKTILRSKESLSRKPAVEEMSEKIQEDIKTIYENVETRLQNQTARPANLGGSKCGRKTLQVFQALLDQHVIRSTGERDTSLLSDIFLTQGTPIRFPSLLSQFRSPDVCLEKMKPLTERISGQTNNKQVSLPRQKSCMSWVAPSMTEHIPLVDIEYVMPSKTLVCPASSKKIYSDFSEKEKENVPSDCLPTTDNNTQSNDEEKNKNVEDRTKPLKAETKRKRAAPKAVASKKKCCKKLLPQIKGQSTLDFFMRK